MGRGVPPGLGPGGLGMGWAVSPGPQLSECAGDLCSPLPCAVWVGPTAPGDALGILTVKGITKQFGKAAEFR